MTTKNRILKGHEWDVVEENIAALPDGNFSIGIGAHLMEASGFTGPQIRDAVGQIIGDFKDRGAYLIMIGSTKCYANMHGKAVEVGTRKDFEELGLGKVCDLLDRQFCEM